MSDYVLSRGEAIWIDAVKGELISSEKSSNTEVNESLGLPNSKGDFNHRQIYSTTIDNQKVWLRTKDGIDQHFDISDFNVPVLVGHRISIAWGSRKGSPSGSVLAVRNDSTGELQHANLARLPLYLWRKDWGLRGTRTEPLLILLLCGIVFSVWQYNPRAGPWFVPFGAGVIFGLLIFVAGSAIGLTPVSRKVRKMRQEIKALCERELAS